MTKQDALKLKWRQEQMKERLRTGVHIRLASDSPPQGGTDWQLTEVDAFDKSRSAQLLANVFVKCCMFNFICF